MNPIKRKDTITIVNNNPMEEAGNFRRLRRRLIVAPMHHCYWITLLMVICQCRYTNGFVSQPSLRSNHHHLLIPHHSVATTTTTTLNNAAAASSSRDDENADRPATVPKHVAFICDGNSRWAEARYLPAAIGHAAGADKLLDCIDSLQKAGVEYCTIYGFSTENWSRNEKEIRDILAVIEQTAKQYRANVKVKILGDMEDPRLPTSVRDALLKIERDTHAAAASTLKDGDDVSQKQQQLTVCVAINYGGRQDIVNASLKLAKAIAEGRIDPSEVTEDTFGSLLFTADIPDPDLVIRTGGDQRISNFLLWNLAYAELYFSDGLWPDFDELELNKALVWFASRSRRFGGRVPSSQSPSLKQSHKP
mmetsp:Transcript_31066/g.51320  ORF Transcript_31066/g.51320 Transcript_31066/m.51320 type:complete len:363 (+) Transcript_31066:176-1264(+)